VTRSRFNITSSWLDPPMIAPTFGWRGFAFVKGSLPFQTAARKCWRPRPRSPLSAGEAQPYQHRSGPALISGLQLGITERLSCLCSLAHQPAHSASVLAPVFDHATGKAQCGQDQKPWPGRLFPGLPAERSPPLKFVPICHQPNANSRHPFSSNETIGSRPNAAP
jgi:hypothetical protein